MKTLGFVGLGLMGKPMAKNLMKGGYGLIVHDVNRAPVKELVAAGAKEAFSPKEVAQAVEVLFTSLPNDQVVEEVDPGKGRPSRRDEEGVYPGRDQHDLAPYGQKSGYQIKRRRESRCWTPL